MGWSGPNCKGRILRAEGYAFDTPLEGITHQDEKSVSWRSTTAGDSDGLILDLDSPPDANLFFSSPQVNFQIRLSDIRPHPTIIDAGGIRQQVRVQRLSTLPGVRAVQFEFTDSDWRPGWKAYYLRVVQRNGAMAWSSPVFVYRETG